MNQLSMLTWMSICTKMKTNRVHTSLSPQLELSWPSLLLFTCVTWMIWNDNQAPIKSRKTVEPCSNFIKPKKNNRYFWCFRIGNKNKRKQAKKSKIFLDFRIANHNEKMKQTKKQMKRNNRNVFGLFVFWKLETKARTTKRKKTNINTQTQQVAEIYQPRTAGKDRFFWKFSIAHVEKFSTNESSITTWGICSKIGSSKFHSGYLYELLWWQHRICF